MSATILDHCKKACKDAMISGHLVAISPVHLKMFVDFVEAILILGDSPLPAAEEKAHKALEGLMDTFTAKGTDDANAN